MCPGPVRSHSCPQACWRWESIQRPADSLSMPCLCRSGQREAVGWTRQLPVSEQLDSSGTRKTRPASGTSTAYPIFGRQRARWIETECLAMVEVLPAGQVQSASVHRRCPGANHARTARLEKGNCLAPAPCSFLGRDKRQCRGCRPAVAHCRRFHELGSKLEAVPLPLTRNVAATAQKYD
jgi:hypothetical protein